MFYAYVLRFDMTDTVQTFLELNGASVTDVWFRDQWSPHVGESVCTVEELLLNLVIRQFHKKENCFAAGVKDARRGENKNCRG